MTYEEIESVLRGKALEVSWVERKNACFFIRKIVEIEKTNYVQWGNREKRVRKWRVFIRFDKSITDIFAFSMNQDSAMELCQMGKCQLTYKYGRIIYVKLI